MSQFEFVAVLLSIVFGLALTHVLSGSIRLLFEERIDDERLAWALAVTIGLVVNWWSLFEWRDVEVWTFGTYVYLLVWATSSYAMAASLFPGTLGPGLGETRGWRIFLAIFAASMLLDIGEAALTGELFDNPWYLPALAHWIGLILFLLLRPRRPARSRAIGWYVFLSVLLYSSSVRWLLGA